MNIKRKDYLFYTPKIIKPKIVWWYCLPLVLLSLWGIVNVFYWEVYKGYSACDICKWHRILYVALFICSLLFLTWRKYLFKLAILVTLGLEMIVSVVQILGFSCEPGICKRVSLVDKLNFSFVGCVLFFIFFFELRTYLKRQKQLNLRVKHRSEHFPNFKVKCLL